MNSYTKPSKTLNTNFLNTRLLNTNSLNTRLLNTNSLSTNSLNTNPLDTNFINTRLLNKRPLNTSHLCTKYLRTIACSILLALVAFSCSTGRRAQIFTESELAIINDTLSGLMKVYVVTDKSDSTLLRLKTAELTEAEIRSEAYKTLSTRMVKTVTDSTVDGVGIAGPQVGISRRIVAVQRFDKEGAPFEVYPNIYIKEYSQETVPGREGCLSVPAESLSNSEKGAPVVRSQWVIISYTNPETLQNVQDTVKGYTARIFQHETDHLEGILYTDRLN